MKLERENKTLYEELSAADDHLKTLQTEALRSNHRKAYDDPKTTQ